MAALLHQADIPYSYPNAFATYAKSLLLGLLTPGRLGEFVKVGMVTSHTTVTGPKAFPSALVDRVFDLYFILAIGIVAVFRYSVLEGHAGLQLGLFVAFCMVIPLVVLNVRVAEYLRRLLKRAHTPEVVLLSMDETVAQWSRMSIANLMYCSGLAVLAYVVFFVQCQLSAYAVSVYISFIDMVLIMAVTNVISLLPISIAGIGVRDASLIVMLGRLGVGDAHALAFSLSVLVTFYLGGGLVGILAWLWDSRGHRA